MTRALVPFALLFSVLALSGCQKQEEAAAVPAALTAPASTDDAEWKAYLGQVIGRNQEGVTDRVFSYYLPVGSDTPA
jgi:uncharacterized lipoprotein YbaY